MSKAEMPMLFNLPEKRHMILSFVAYRARNKYFHNWFVINVVWLIWFMEEDPKLLSVCKYLIVNVLSNFACASEIVLNFCKPAINDNDNSCQKRIWRGDCTEEGGEEFSRTKGEGFCLVFCLIVCFLCIDSMTVSDFLAP